MELSVKAAVNPTEDPNKVKAAVLNLVDMELTMVEENGQSYVVGVSHSLSSLSPLRKLIGKAGIARLAREVLRSSAVGDTIEIKLHKQAAFAGAVSFVSQDGESPMGPIIITITAVDPGKVIDWIAPPPRRLDGLHR
ncbi:hypothetical protein GCM10007981_02070 [Thermocladium modestius]|uniref:UPF0201 protein GCM10007981_02070 n=1 Tax=Thermocladium modestius TaxID=62609 RepID=A0A830GTQ9_9CREN|nr:RNA-binding domain-containing protein [Thermocladium modestius]GGP19229.1 hypothetical protein GCM10007981_02070 [Thermocladium modestius]